MAIKRRPFQGVLNILSFNRHFYYWGLGVLAAVVLSRFLFIWPTVVFGIVAGAFTYGLVMPLLVSAYVYDFSGYYSLSWLEGLVEGGEQVKSIVNINAGFDETSFLIEERFPGAQLRVFDFYDAGRHTEAAIVRARRVSLVYPDTQAIASNAVPMEDGSVDVVFLLSAIHEIRDNEEKVRFLGECRRVCKPTGRVILVEHLRDFPNFLAFSVGFTHFFSRRVWRRSFELAGFGAIRERKFTPFMSVFQCQS